MCARTRHTFNPVPVMIKDFGVELTSVQLLRKIVWIQDKKGFSPSRRTVLYRFV
jgi:hypothetical protein